MSIEDVVKQAMLNRGLPVEGVADEDVITSNIDTLIQQSIEELIQFSGIRLERLLLIRRIFKRVLFHLIRFKNSSSISAIKRKIDPRYRDYVRIILDKSVQHGLVIEHETVNGKKVYSINHIYQDKVLDFLSKGGSK